MSITNDIEIGDRKTEHVCTLTNTKYALPNLNPNHTFMEAFVHNYRKLIFISEEHPYSKEYVPYYSEIRRIQYMHYLSKSQIIHPFSKLYAYYNVVMIFVYYFIMLYLPAEAAYDLYDHPEYDVFSPHTFRFSVFMIKLILCGMMVVRFFVGYTIPKERKIVMDPKKIAKHYIFSWFFVPDLLSSLPEPFFIENHDIQIIVNGFGVLQIMRLPTLHFYSREAADYFNIRHKWTRNIKKLLIFYVLLHWSACSQLFLQHMKILVEPGFTEDSWIYTADIDINKFFDVYLQCLYLAAGQILCINYISFEVFFSKRIHLDEAVWEVITSMVGKILTIYVSILVLDHLLGHRSLETQYQETLSQVRCFMRKKKLSFNIQKKIVNFYQFKYHDKIFEETKMTNLISDKLRAEINLNVCSKMVHNIPFLTKLPLEQLEHLVTHLKSEIYLPHDIIIKAGTTGNCMYFLASGTVAVWSMSGKEICHLQDGAFFGEIELIFKDKKRTANIIALEICQVYKLGRNMFQRCFKTTQNQKLYAMIEDVAKERLEAIDKYAELQFVLPEL